MSNNFLYFPFSNTINPLIGTVKVPYKSQNNTKYKSVKIDCPIGVYLRFTNYTQLYAVTKTINIYSKSNSTIEVYKNGSYYSSISNLSYTGTNMNKGFVMSPIQTQTPFSFKSYYYQVSCEFYPEENNGTTEDTYTFYASIYYNATLSPSYASPLTYLAQDSITYIIDVNTATSTSSFQYFSYADGSTNSPGYIPYSIKSEAHYATDWVNPQLANYYTPIVPSLWTGIYQLAALYANNLIVTNGLVITDGNINSAGQQKTWYITGAGGNGITPSGNIIGAGSSNLGGYYFSNVSVYGGAESTNFNSNTGIFKASVSGTYFFQLNVFKNSTNTIGRNLQFITSSFMGNQYCHFNEQSADSESVFQWTAMIYLKANGTAYFYAENCPITLFYGPGHTNLTITKIF